MVLSFVGKSFVTDQDVIGAIGHLAGTGSDGDVVGAIDITDQRIDSKCRVVDAGTIMRSLWTGKTFGTLLTLNGPSGHLALPWANRWHPSAAGALHPAPMAPSAPATPSNTLLTFGASLSLDALSADKTVAGRSAPCGSVGYRPHRWRRRRHRLHRLHRLQSAPIGDQQHLEYLAHLADLVDAGHRTSLVVTIFPSLKSNSVKRAIAVDAGGHQRC